MNNRIANDLIRYAELVEDGALISPEEMNCASVMRLAAEALAQPEQDKERCVGCEACIDTACGRDECPKGWPKAAKPEQEPVASCNGMPAYEGPLSKTQRKQLTQDLDAPLTLNGVALYPQRTAAEGEDTQRAWVWLTDEEIGAILEGVNAYGTRLYTFARAIEAKLKEKNTRNGGCL